MAEALTQAGAYLLTSTGKLPNAAVVSPGEVWSDKRASGIILPGTCVKPVLVEGVGSVAPVEAGDEVVDELNVEAATSTEAIRQATLSVALRQIMVPDINVGSQYNPALGPNEIVNLPIAANDWVRTYHTGVLSLTLVVPGKYAEGDIIGWDPGGVRPKFKAEGEGAWATVSAGGVVKGTGIFIVQRPPRYYGSEEEAILTCRFLRSNQ